MQEKLVETINLPQILMTHHLNPYFARRKSVKIKMNILKVKDKFLAKTAQ
jgi:hypothetical protein